jgi:hypothetical protein
MVGKLKWLALLLAIAGLGARPAFADAFTNSAAFHAAAASFGPTVTANFDDLVSGTIIPQGGTADGITFHYNIFNGAQLLEISNVFDTTSPPNYLGSNDPGTFAFLPGDSITMSFASPTNALGMFIILNGTPMADDFTLNIGSAQASSSTDLQSFPALNGLVLFLGITSATDFSSATISMSNNAANYNWNLDDVSRTTPEPGSLLLLATGLAAFVRRIRKP